MNLMIVESPTKAKHIREFLPEGFCVEASMGHIYRLPINSLGINVNSGFNVSYEIPPDKVEIVAELKSIASQAEKIFLATDCDQEGEMISQSILSEFDLEDQKKCARITFEEITKKAVLKALEHPREINSNLVAAQKARQVLDRLVGYKVSPQLWDNVAKKTSAGRVQSVALRIICDRQDAIDAFKPEEFWQVDALLKGLKGTFWARVVTGDSDENRFRDEKLAKTALEALKTADFKLRKAERKSKNQGAYPPFDTAAMQSTANAVLDWDIERTMTTAQSLFEAGKITYHRSDSFNIADEGIEMVRPWIQQNLGEKYLPKTKNVFKQKSAVAAQEAHEAIRPTEIADEGKSLKEDEQILYELIRNRFIACQMADQILDTVVYHVRSSSGHDLIAKGQSVAFDGWKRVWSYGKTEELVLPDVATGEKLDLQETRCAKSSTKPPKRYNEGTLVKDLKDNGVGRPSTWQTLAKTLRDRGYVVNDGKALVPTELGGNVCAYLKRNYQDFFMDIKFTAQLLDEIDEIADGKKQFLEVVQGFYDTLAKKLGDRILEDEATGKKCPECGVGEVLFRHGKFGKYPSCNNYPDCKARLIEQDGKFVLKPEPKSTGYKCSVCKVGDIVKRNGPFGDYYTCNRYPECKARYRAGLTKGFVLKA